MWMYYLGKKITTPLQEVEEQEEGELSVGENLIMFIRGTHLRLRLKPQGMNFQMPGADLDRH